MQDQIVYTFIPPILNNSVHGLLKTDHSIRTNRIVVLTESTVTRQLLGSDTGSFTITVSGTDTL